MAKNICFVTSTRADWGLLKPLVLALKTSDQVTVSVIATNMHLDERYGHTVDEILADGVAVDACVPMSPDSDDEVSRAKAMAQCMAGIADAFEAIKPDVLVVLGDRYEILAVASAAAVMHIPVVHIAGGEISEGANDDSFRHAITKLSRLHLTATEAYRQRVIAMGESPDTVINTGAIGVWNAFNTPLMTADELGADLGIDFKRERVALFTFHPATNDMSSTPARQIEAILEALRRFPELTYVMTYPNNDAHGADIIRCVESFAASGDVKVVAVKSLGMRRYQSLLPLCACVIGNSSSGIVEAPSAGVPTVDIGIRQRGRIAAPSVLHCEASTESVAACISEALSPEVRALASLRENPYYKADTLAGMVDAILRFMRSLPLEPKKFYDV